MGGQDKGLVELNGRPLVAWTLERLLPQVSTALISVNRNQDRYAGLGYPIVNDALPDYPGPLAGLHAGLVACSTPLLACVPCDTPNFPPNLVAKLLAAIMQQAAPAAWAATDEGEHPVFMVCKKDLATSLGDYLNQGGRRVRDWLKQAGAVPAWFPDEKAFVNLNTLEALAKASERRDA
jgi:molybdenum cofactor guanylyltransferase